MMVYPNSLKYYGSPTIIRFDNFTNRYVYQLLNHEIASNINIKNKITDKTYPSFSQVDNLDDANVNRDEINFILDLSSNWAADVKILIADCLDGDACHAESNSLAFYVIRHF